LFITVSGEESKFCAQLEVLLRGQSHKVTTVCPLAGIRQALQGLPPHLLVVAAGPERDSVPELLKSIRQEAGLRQLPILCVNPRGGACDGVAYLDSGADDFINRPFNPHIFLARVRTLLRRRVWSGDIEEDQATVLMCGGLSMNLVSRQVLLSGHPIVLTRLEFDLLAYLVRHMEQAFQRQELLEAVWNYPQEVTTRTLDKHVETLRRKLGSFAACLETVHGVGYRLSPPKVRPVKNRD